ncbi:GNAT family protein [Anaerolineales bacterium]
MLQGNKVLLRAIEQDDIDKLHRFANDLEVELASGGAPPTPQPLLQFMAEFERSSQSGPPTEQVNFAIDVDGKLIGQCGIYRFDRLAHHCQLGITIGDKAYWGKGYGREAVGLLVDYAFRYRNMRKVGLKVYASNERAIRAYQSVGFVEEGRLREHVFSNGAYEDVILMGIFREGHLER